jgi:truncated hemoglobin YjbI
MTSETFYDQVGGHETFRKLAQQFYAGVAGDPELRALYPQSDLDPAQMRFRMFLEQYWAVRPRTRKNGATPGCGYDTPRSRSPSPSATGGSST